ncbi:MULTISPECIES: hypothetical protein [Macrococcus]|uniref:hypothetical protein n=1 Tax=Macrococcus TaxID=69965 RepID=UPI00100B340A|nr:MULTISPECIES: hypothetical protein [Macrococcus]RXK18374.1 hypothetical protein ER639_06705 [Macrococcus sp. DPC7161]UBH08108.1 hypothetical protein LAU41_08770 [Macrococcus armenti]UBH10337.1 hypothetical protein LAU38_08680 [Macrococcus armenti]UBH14814.1 hypothetical protein LAU44_08550 [Macrococcus armenti]UBH17173.1 hypothetical protein LAU39_08580 [Macrococcus armenti]
MKNHIDITFQMINSKEKYDLSIPEFITFNELYLLVCDAYQIDVSLNYPIFKNLNKGIVMTPDDIVSEQVISNGDLLILL